MSQDRLQQLMIIIRNRKHVSIGELKQMFGRDTDKLADKMVQEGLAKVVGGNLIKVEKGPWG